MTNNPYAPTEQVMTGTAIGLKEAGISEDQFISAAPLAACRLCGAIYQTQLHRNLYWFRQQGKEPPLLLKRVLQLNDKWRERHANDMHTHAEIEAFTKTGWALTPEAANVLAPYGIIPLGNQHIDIMDALYESSRAPDLTHLQGGE
jgi:hypothetical protein